MTHFGIAPLVRNQELRTDKTFSVSSERCLRMQFRGDHLVYAMKWFALMAMMFDAMGYLLADDRRWRRVGGAASIADIQS